MNNDRETALKLLKALQLAVEHLEYCGYGDKWEKECAFADHLPTQLNDALSNSAKELGIKL